MDVHAYCGVYLQESDRMRRNIAGVLLVVAFVAFFATRAAIGNRAALVVFVVLLLANGAAIEAGRAPRS